ITPSQTSSSPWSIIGLLLTCVECLLLGWFVLGMVRIIRAMVNRLTVHQIYPQAIWVFSHLIQLWYTLMVPFILIHGTFASRAERVAMPYFLSMILWIGIALWCYRKYGGPLPRMPRAARRQAQATAQLLEQLD